MKHYPNPQGHEDNLKPLGAMETEASRLTGCTKLVGMDRCGESRNGESMWCYEHDKQWAKKVTHGRTA